MPNSNKLREEGEDVSNQQLGLVSGSYLLSCRTHWSLTRLGICGPDLFLSASYLSAWWSVLVPSWMHYSAWLMLPVQSFHIGHTTWNWSV